ncbi:hypothetical protein G7046_g3341 [Stylonectria norvegica]|nr:hypothetical protein G7046_g3341 [Stylonectria norvegica]
MQELNDDDSSPIMKANIPSQTPKPHKKAPWACLQCRARKVRCDVSQTGRPCTRCRRNCESCLEHPSDQRAIARRRRKEAESKSQALHNCLTISSPSPNTSRGSDVKTTLPTTALTASSTGPLARANIALQHPCPTESPSSSVFYLDYPFLQVGNLENLLSGDIDYLELQGCFQVPRREVLDEIVQQYFLHVHPLLPLFHEGDFWHMYSHRGPADVSAPKMSLLVWQSLMFASCNFTSPAVIEALGFSSIRQAKSGFYRKAKLLYDFETESSPISIAQASLLLSYRSSFATLGVKKPNTTWLSIAIQHAEIADANHYTSYQMNSSTPSKEELKLQSTLKRLWWCCVIRDRVLPLCVRRSIQIDRARFNFATNVPLRYADLEDEIQSSSVYGAKTKRHLIRVFEKFVELCIILTDVLAMAYPPDERRPGESTLGLDTSRIWRAKNALREWEKDTSLRLQDLADSEISLGSTDDRSIHESVTLYIDLMNMYYHSSWLALCHHEALGLMGSSGQAYNSISDLSSATRQNQQELHSAASEVTKCLERLHRLQLDRWLPSSAVACTATPLALHVLDVKLSAMSLSSDSPEPDLRSVQKHVRLKSLIDSMKTYHAQYDVADFVVNAVRHIVDLIQLEGIHPVIGSSAKDSFEWTDILSMNPSLYLRLALTIDLSLSKDRLPDDRDFPPSLRGLFAGDLSPIKSLLVQRRGNSHLAMIEGGSTTAISIPPTISSTMEDWLRCSQRMDPAVPPSSESTKESMDLALEGDGIETPSAAFEEADTLGDYRFEMLDCVEISEEHAFHLEQFMGEVVDTLPDPLTSSSLHDIIRAAL